jgi:hypothetical protein
MVYEFHDAKEAVKTLCDSFEKDCPGDLVEVVETYHHRSMATPRKVRVEALRPVLNDMCKNFPRAFIRYDAEDVNGEIGLIWCHCTDKERANCGQVGHCEGAPESPRVTIILEEHAGRPVLVGSHRPPAQG